MNCKKGMIILIITVFLFSIASVCASDANTTAMAMVDEHTTEEIDEISSAPNTGEKLELTSSEMLGNTKTVTEHTFNAIEKEIDNDTIIYLEPGKYTGTSEIKINSINNLKIIGNSTILDAEKKTRIAYIKDSTNITLQGITFTNATSYNGGAIFLQNSANCKIADCIFTNNNGIIGGAIGGYYSPNGTITNTTLTNNTATQSGGAISFQSCDNGTITNTTLTNNNATYDGGAILWIWCDNGIITNTTLTNNTSKQNGGAISWYESPNGIITNTTLTNNTATSGGAINWEGSLNGIITNTLLTNNTAKQNGGAIRWLNSPNGIITNTTLTNNNATYGGAIQWATSDNGKITNTTLTNNNATTGGGAIHWENSHNGTITNTQLTNNNAKQNGGAINWYNSHNGTITNTTLTNNNAKQNGGAIHWSFSDNGTITNTTLTNNNAKQNGGAIFWGGSSNGTIANTTLTNNNAQKVGGAISWDNSPNGKITNTTLTNNNATFGGAINWESSDNGTITSNIFTNNNAQNNTIYIYNAYSGENLTVNNNIFLNNNATEIGFYKTDTTSNTDYNWFGHNETNYKNNPKIENCKIWLFLNATAKPDTITILDTSNITYKLWMYNSTNENTSEYDNTPLKPVNLTVTSTSGLITSTQLGKAVTFQPTAIGTDMITAKIENAEYTKTLTVTDGTTFLDLNRTINGNKNDTIILDRDYTYNQTTDYNLKEGIIISRKVTIIGNGHTINATGKARIFQIKSDNVTIQKTTFTNATAYNGGAINLENSANCKVADCIFTNNNAQKYGGAIHWEYSNNGKIISSIFTNNNATTEGGAINWRYSPNGTITNTTLTNNSATYDGGAISWNNSPNGKITNTQLTNNTAQGNGGAIFWDYGDNGTIANTTLTNNNAQEFGGAIFWGGSSNGTIANTTLTNNNAQKVGGAISWDNSPNGKITNTTLTNNSATYYGGAIHWEYSSNGKIISSIFTNNNADEGGAIYWGDCDNGKITSNIFTNHPPQDNIISLYPGHNSTINNNIFLNNNAREILVNQYDTTQNTDYNWFGHNETNYKNNRNIENCKIWLFLNATANPNPITILDTSNITFKLWMYNSTNENTSEYDNTLLKPVNLTVTSTSGLTTSTQLGKAITYKPTAIGTDIITAKIENASYTIYLNVNKADSNLSLVDEEVPYSENTTLTLNYNSNATGKVNITLTGKKHNQKITDINLNTTIGLENILPDEYDITVKYSGDETFLNTTATGKLSVLKLESNINPQPYDINVTDKNGLMFIITLPENATGNLTISNGKTINIEKEGKKEKGKLTINITNNAYPVGEYKWTFTYLGDDIYNNSTDKATSNILIIQTAITPENKTIELTFEDESKINYTTQPDNLNEIKFESNNTNIVTVDADGSIKAVGAGQAKITIKYLGNENYTASNATVTVTVNKANSTLTVSDVTFDYGQRGSANTTFTGASGIVAAVNDLGAVVEINGNVITIFNLTAGKYRLTVTTVPDANHEETTEFADVTVNKIDSDVDVAVPAIYYGTSADVNVTYDGATGIVAEIDGKNLTVKGNVIAIPDDLDAGEYNLTVTTVPDSNHNEISKDFTFSVNPVNSTLDVDDAETVYGESVEVNVTYDGATGIVAEIDGKNLSVKDNMIVIPDDLDAGEYKLTVTTVPDSNHEAVSKQATVTVNKANSTLTVSDVTFDYGQRGSANTTFTGASGIVAAVNDLGAVVEINGNVITIFNLTAGKYRLTVTTVPDANHEETTEFADVTVNKIDSDVDVTVQVIYYGTSADVTATYEGATGIVAEIDGKNLSVKGNVIAIPDDLDAGTYNLTVTTVPDSNHNEISKDFTFSVNLVNSTLDVDDAETVYGRSVEVNVTYEGATGIVAEIDGKNLSVKGNVIAIPDDLDAGEYKLTVTTVPDSNHEAVSKQATVTVNKMETEILAQNIKTTYNVDRKLTITLKDSENKAIAGEKITVNINGEKTYTTDKNGQVQISTKGLASDTYQAKIAFDGSANYKNSAKNISITVKKATPKLTAKNKAFKSGDKTKKYSISLKDNLGKPMKNVWVKLTIAKTTYKAKTNAKGIATFKLSKLSKTSKATVKYVGGKNYKAASKKVKLSVKSAFKTISYGSKNHPMVKKIQRALKNNGYYLTAHGHYLKIDGIFHEWTELAVRQFQKANGLKVTGKVDEKTAKKLKII